MDATSGSCCNQPLQHVVCSCGGLKPTIATCCFHFMGSPGSPPTTWLGALPVKNLSFETGRVMARTLPKPTSCGWNLVFINKQTITIKEPMSTPQPAKACQPQESRKTDQHLHNFTSADLHLHIFTSADLHLHIFTSADL